MPNQLEQLILRARQTRLFRSEIAARSGLDENTVGRLLNGKSNPLLSTIQKVERVVADEEARLRQQLATGPTGSEAA